jgi:hypothetical protein
MDFITFNIASKEYIDLSCPKCGNTKRVIISKTPNIGRVYKITCKCHHHFFAVFDRRKHRRKKLDLVGTYSLSRSFTDNIINIIDLSSGGLAFVRTDKNKLSIGDKISIRFNLDNPDGDLIECTAIIRNISNKKVSAEFVNMKGKMQTTLGFYLL